MKVIGRSLQSNSVICEIGLIENNIGGDGVKEAVHSLLSNNLQLLNLRENNIGDEGAFEVARAISENNVPSSIYLGIFKRNKRNKI